VDFAGAGASEPGSAPGSAKQTRAAPPLGPQPFDFQRLVAHAQQSVRIALTHAPQSIFDSRLPSASAGSHRHCLSAAPRVATLSHPTLVSTASDTALTTTHAGTVEGSHWRLHLRLKVDCLFRVLHKPRRCCQQLSSTCRVHCEKLDRGASASSRRCLPRKAESALAGSQRVRGRAPYRPKLQWSFYQQL
jgi:hypothetical protein